MDKIFKIFLQLNNKNGSPLITLVSLILLLGTSYYTSTAATNAIERTVEKLDSRVSAIELDRQSVPEWRERSAITEEKVKQLEEDITEIKATLIRLESKFDQILINK